MPDEVAYDIVKTFFDHKATIWSPCTARPRTSTSQPGQGELADPVASGRGEILRRKRREDVSERQSARPAGRAPVGRALRASGTA